VHNAWPDTPYSVGPCGADAYPRSLGPSKAFADEGFIVSSLQRRWSMRIQRQGRFFAGDLPVLPVNTGTSGRVDGCGVPDIAGTKG
jgi:hypothetical protein